MSSNQQCLIFGSFHLISLDYIIYLRSGALLLAMTRLLILSRRVTILLNRRQPWMGRHQAKLQPIRIIQPYSISTNNLYQWFIHIIWVQIQNLNYSSYLLHVVVIVLDVFIFYTLYQIFSTHPNGRLVKVDCSPCWISNIGCNGEVKQVIRAIT